jgi:N-formylglutamate deformylase
MQPYRLSQGEAPVLVSVPHAGLEVSKDILARFTPEARLLADTDWHVDRLYDFAADLGCSMLVATHSRYVVDLNRPPDDSNLYPGQDTTGLVPIDTFDGRPIYINDLHPDMAETFARIDAYWRPYHQALEDELERLRARHGHAVLWEAHSIRSRVPRFFEGRLPDLNIGTADGAACAPDLAARVVETAERAGGDYTQICDGRFKGGYSTRAYGRPAEGWHAIQLELAQATYMDEAPPFAYAEEEATQLQATLRPMLETAIDWRPK